MEHPTASEHTVEREKLRLALQEAAKEYGHGLLDGDRFEIQRLADLLDKAATEFASIDLKTRERWNIEALKRAAERMIEEAEKFNAIMGPRPGEKNG